MSTTKWVGGYLPFPPAPVRDTWNKGWEWKLVGVGYRGRADVPRARWGLLKVDGVELLAAVVAQLSMPHILSAGTPSLLLSSGVGVLSWLSHGCLG